MPASPPSTANIEPSPTANPHRLWSSVSISSIMSVQQSSTATMTIAGPSRSSTPIPSASASAESLPPPYEASQPRKPLEASSKMSECTTRVRTWKFEIAFEGGARLSATAPSPGIPGQIIAYIRITVGIIVGSVLGVFGLILSVTVLAVSYLYPSLRTKAPQQKAVKAKKPHDSTRASTSPRSSVDSVTPTPTPAPRPKLEQSSSSSITASSSIPERRVTFQLTPNRTGSSEASSVAVGILSINSPTVPQFATTSDYFENPSPTLSRRDSVMTTSTSTSTSSRGFMGRFIKRRAMTPTSEACSSDVEFITASPATSAPASPSVTTCDLPASDSEGKQQRPKKMSLKLQLKAFKRRSATATSEASTSSPSQVIESILTNASDINEFGAIRTAPLAESSLPTPPPSSKRSKRFSLPHNVPSAPPPSHPNRTNPYGAPYFASMPVAVPKDRSKRASYDGRGAPSSFQPPLSPQRERRVSFDSIANLPSPPAPTMPIAPRIVSDSVASPKKSRFRSSSKPPVASTSPRLIDRHARMQQVAASAYSDSEMAVASSPIRPRSTSRV